MFRRMNVNNSVIDDAIAPYISIVNKEYGDTKQVVLKNLILDEENIKESMDFSMFRNICTYVDELQFGKDPRTEEYNTVVQMLNEVALRYINSNPKFAAAYNFYLVPYFYNSLNKNPLTLFSMNFANTENNVIAAKLAIRAMHYIDELQKIKDGNIYNMHILESLLTRTNIVSAYFVEPYSSVNRYSAPAPVDFNYNAYDKFCNELNNYYSDKTADTTAIDLDIYKQNIDKYDAFIRLVVIDQDNEAAYQMLSDIDKNSGLNFRN